MRLSYQNVRELLRTDGPMTSIDVARYFPQCPRASVCSVISHLLRQPVRTIHIDSFTRDDITGGLKRHLRAVYAYGDKPNARRPPRLTYTEISRKQRETRDVHKRVATSIWTWRPTA